MQEAKKYLENKELWRGIVNPAEFEPQMRDAEIKLMRIEMDENTIRCVDAKSCVLNQPVIVYSVPISFSFVGNKNNYHVANLPPIEVWIDVMTGRIIRTR